MKKIIVILSVLLLSFSNIFSQENTLILVHPTEYNLKLFTYLVDNQIITINNLKVIGVYYYRENYDYSASKKFLTNKQYHYIELKEVNKELLPSQVFKENACTKTFTNLYKNSKGIFFFGGPDLPPNLYDQKTNLLTSITDPYRHYFETSFLFHLLGSFKNENYTPLLASNPKYIVYSICLGMQTMNTATGGTMIQDIPSEVYHLNFVEDVLNLGDNEQHRNYYENLSPDSTLFSGHFHEIKVLNTEPIVGSYRNNLQPLVYSNHHQAIKDLGKDLVAIATSVDGKIIEAVGHKKYPNVLGIQFHPEGTYLHNPEIKYRQTPSDSLISGKQILLNNDSYQFHLEYWKTFSEKMNQ